MQRLLLFAALIISTSALGQVKLARLFSDHVVLQRQKPIPVWGWAKPGEKVKVVLSNQTLNTKAGSDGKWIVRFTQMEAGGPHQLTVSAKSGNASVSDILIGEVWLCSGQSNMEWPVSAAKNFEEEKKNANFPQIRHFRVDHVVSLKPDQDLTSGEWKLANEENVGAFTAVGFFFARELYQKLNIPIGLLHSSWGGSQIEGWISKEMMLTEPELASYAQNLPTTWKEADAIMDRKLKKQLFGDQSVNPTADDERQYIEKGFDAIKGIKTSDPAGQWDWKGLMGFRGKGYMAKQIELNAETAGRATTLVLGENDGQVQIYINGQLVSDETVKGQRKVSVPAGTWKAGKNELLVKVGNVPSAAWFGPGLIGRSQDLAIQDGSQSISISKDWKLAPSFAEPHEYAHLMNNVGTTIYNAMISPLVPFGIRGVLWYQGETNAPRAYQYRKSFPLMINNWRKDWGTNGKPDDFSFYWVQLSSFGGDRDSNKGSGWAELREAQTMTLNLPATGMAVTTDIGNPKDIHPTNKQDVGHRLAVNALKKDYGQDVVYSSPMMDQVRYEGNKAIVSFKFTENGVTIKDKYGYIKGFEIAGEDKVFRFAKAEIKNKEVIVSSEFVAKPVSVRYAWTDAPEDANLFSADGFPFNSFRTDEWPGITVDQKFE